MPRCFIVKKFTGEREKLRTSPLSNLWPSSYTPSSPTAAETAPTPPLTSHLLGHHDLKGHYNDYASEWTSALYGGYCPPTLLPSNHLSPLVSYYHHQISDLPPTPSPTPSPQENHEEEEEDLGPKLGNTPLIDHRRHRESAIPVSVIRSSFIQSSRSDSVIVSSRPQEDLNTAHAILDLSASASQLSRATKPLKILDLTSTSSSVSPRLEHGQHFGTGPSSISSSSSLILGGNGTRQGEIQIHCPEKGPTPLHSPVHGRKTEKLVLVDGTKTVAYTYESFFVSDGRSKRKIQDPICIDQRSRYTCSECGKNYATSSNLSRHKQTHRSLDSQAAKKCPTCNKAYVSMPALAMHVLTHNLSHKCDVCGKAFSRPWLLQGHLRSHTGERPYGCAHCGKAFADRSNLRAHMQTHSALKAFSCSRCNKAFALKAYLNKHYESACFKDGGSPPVSIASSEASISVI